VKESWFPDADRATNFDWAGAVGTDLEILSYDFLPRLRRYRSTGRARGISAGSGMPAATSALSICTRNTRVELFT